MAFRFKRLGIPGLMLISPEVFGDSRGSFMESYKFSEFRDNGIGCIFNQDAHSVSRKGVLRGLHYQVAPAEQSKLIMVIRGEIFDVAVDIRRESPYYGRWIGKKLSERNGLMIFIPTGFAHGFVALKDNTEVLYKITKEYSKRHERGIVWNDPKIGIKWPVRHPLVSKKDSQLPQLS